MTNNNASRRRPSPANNNKPARPSNYEFVKYVGTGTEVVDDLAAGMAPSWRLLEIAKWHDAKHTGRNSRIAGRLLAMAGQQDAMWVAA
ncbi:hypothetical protein HJB67_12835 [Rhizobium lentis]|uniref:hypothetical protein n=1 Tax=Rhizobium lentis TaxID=1138194 RepID=UPI001C83E614|nr:hypothetical protein [Rhizobium lentis]MBX5010840.1 hypothetical protein [Rhizobium lentis]